MARLQEAIECAQLAGQDDIVQRATAEHGRLRARLDRDYRQHWNRYQLKKRIGRLREAEDDVAYLSALGWPQAGPDGDALRRDHEQLLQARGGSR